jgi:DNA-binding CsgD family transcriptional regulator
MDHIVILGYVVILMAGTWGAVSTYQTYRRFHLPFLKSLFQYILAFNVMVFFYFITRYTVVNIFGREPTDTRPLVVTCLSLAIFAVESGLAYTLVRVVVDLGGGGGSKAVKRAFASVAALFGVSYLIALTLLLTRNVVGWMMGTTFVLIFTVLAVTISAPAVLALRSRTEPDPGRQRTIRAFSYLLLSGYIPFTASLLLPAPLRDHGTAVTQLWLNLIPLVWLYQFFFPHYARFSATDESAFLDGLAQKFNISKREREIMELILEGKSNKEIEELLFISFNTVKNHVYHLYQKLGINSRSQLMHLVMRNNHP